MLVRKWTGWEPRAMTYVRFQGVLERIGKLRRYEPGGGVTKDELIAEHLAAKKAEADDF
jgi:hypothetical protein